MSTATEVTPSKPDSIEKGIFLTSHTKQVHACKVREDLGCGITRCGIAFLLGNWCYKPDATFGDPPREGKDGTWTRCPTCDATPNYQGTKNKWTNYKGMVRRTLEMLGKL